MCEKAPVIGTGVIKKCGGIPVLFRPWAQPGTNRVLVDIV
jgi:hypothetical protein